MNSKKKINRTWIKRGIITVIALLAVWYIFCLPTKLFHVPYATVISDHEGELLGARIAEDGQWRFPPCDDVPEKIEACLLEFEDRHFYYHWGVNPISIFKALSSNLKEKKVVRGGSTITMQTIRLSRNQARTVREKIIEAIWATRLEFRYSKEEILALYASHAPFGGNVVGLDAAAWRYFSRPPDRLSWAEAATLAVLPNSPSMIHLSKGRNSLLEKRNRLLSRLKEREVIDETTYELAIQEPLPEEPRPLPQIAPHLTDLFFNDRRGMETTTSIDKDLQLQIEQVLEHWNDQFLRSDIRNLAALVVEVETNRVLAYCGNVRYDEVYSGNQVDIIRAPRSTGSILKPFLYAAMLQEGELLPRTLQPDIPLNINGFAPQNFNLQYAGAVPADEVISQSLNIPSVYMLRQYSIPKFHSLLKQAGLTTLTRPPSHYGLSLILGGAEATLWEVTEVYTNMARSLLNLPNTQISLTDEEGKTSKHTFRPGAVWQTFEAIKEVNRPDEIDWSLIPSMQTIAWKTGTSYGFRDAWAVGVTPKYAVGVWVGNASGEGKPGLVGARTAGPVLFDLFNLLPASPWFEIPYSEFDEAEVCRQSGHLSSRFCDEVDTLLILPEGLRTKLCPYHHRIHLSADGNHRVYEGCSEEEATLQANWFTLPPAWEWYYKQHHPEYKPLPPLTPNCGEDRLTPMQFIYPSMNARIYLPKQQSGERAELTFELAHSNRQSSVYWHLDNTYLTATEDFHKVSFAPSPGKHSMTVVDNDGNTLSLTFFVEASDR